MSINMGTFKVIVYDYLRNYLSEDEYEITVKQHSETYGCMKTGLFISNRVSPFLVPVILLDNFLDDFNNGTTIDTIIKQIIVIYNKHNYITSKIAIPDFSDFEGVKDHIILKIVGEQYDSDIKEITPYIKIYDDLLIIFSVLTYYDKNLVQNYFISNELFKSWSIDITSLYEIALVNTMKYFPIRINKTSDIEKLIMNDTPCSYSIMDEPTTYVLTNTTTLNGAATMLYPNIIREYAERIGMSTLIIPSSKHEVLVMPKYISITYAISMVREVNKTLKLEDILSDSVYMYDLEKQLIVNVSKEY